MILSSAANQGSIYHWTRDHRLHHKFSDTDLDPHTIKKGFFFAHVGWLLQPKSSELIK
jgi:stearoyl-CoA desaturase (delta-9 desaturase)